MNDNYAKIVQDNLARLYENLPAKLAEALSAEQDGDSFSFDAFGEKCQIQPGGITLGGQEQAGVLGILISLYALHAQPVSCVTEPFMAFRDFPDSMPYVGAFVTHTEHLLLPHVERIKDTWESLTTPLQGEKAPADMGGDFAFVVWPLPKVALCYIFYEADEDFPASVTCLFSNNASAYLPMDGLADIGEYTSKKLISDLSI